MSVRWKIESCVIIAAQGAMEGVAPFNRCRPVIQSPDRPGLYGIVNTYWGDFVLVTEVDDRTFEDALLDKEWCQIGPIPLSPYADVWMLRSSFPFRDEALSEMQTVHGPE